MRITTVILVITAIVFCIGTVSAIEPNLTYLSDKYLYVTGNGTHLSTTFTDIAPSPHTIYTTASGAYVSTTGAPVFGTGQMNFTGWGYATLPNTNMFFTDGLASSKALWINASKSQARQIIGSRQDDNGPNIGEGISLYTNNNIYVYCENSTGSAIMIGSSSIIPYNVPLYVVVTKTTGNLFSFYINGTLQGTQQMVGVPTASSRLVYNIGGNISAGAYKGNFTGAIDDFTVYNSVIDGTVVPSQEIVSNPSSAFTANATSGTSPLTVQFTNWSVGNPALAYSWRLRNVTGNNTELAAFSTSASPVYTLYDGNWTVNLTVTNALGSSSSFAFVNVSALSPSAPIGIFSGTPTTGTVPMNVSFTDSSVSGITDWSWAFGDGNTSTLQNPEYQYLGAGTYSVALMVTNASGLNTTTKTNYVTVNPMVASFTANNTVGINPMTVQFTGSSTGGVDAWYWEFGDGNTSVAQSPVFVYGVNGTFNVNMRATNLTSGAFDWENKTGYITIYGTPDGFNQQDIELDPQFTLTIHFTDSSTGAAIPVVIVSTSDGQSYTTTNGTAYFTEPYSVVVVYASSDGYYGISTSYVMDEDRDVTIQLTTLQETSVQQQVYPHYVTFHVKEGFGSAVPDVDVSVLGVSTSTGNWDWVAQLLGLPLDEVPVNGTYMNQTTDSLGRATFYMIPTGKYNITFTKTGYTITPMVLVPQDTDYVIFATSTSELYYREGVDELAAVNISITTRAFNESYAFINLTYYDSTGGTTGGTIRVLQKSDTPWTANTMMASWPVTGNIFTNSTGILHIQQVSGYIEANISHSTFGAVLRSYPYSFNSVPVQFLGFGSDISLLVAFGIMAFTLMLAGAAHARQVLVIVCIQGWIFDAMHWFDSLVARGVPHVSVIGALGVATIIAILANVEMRKKKEKY
jgi:PKD repeat protein